MTKNKKKKEREEALKNRTATGARKKENQKVNRQSGQQKRQIVANN